MIKKILVTLLIVPIIGFAIYSYIHLKEIKTPVSPIITAIPTNATLIIECNQGKGFWQKLTQKNTIWNQLQETSYFSTLNGKINFVDSLFKSGTAVYNLIKKETLFISAHKDGVSSYDFLFYINLPVSTKREFLNDFIKNASPKTATKTDRIYDGITINELKLSEQQSFHYLFSKGIFICSFSKLLAEDAVKQLNSGSSLMNNPSFASVMETKGNKVDGTVFINYSTVGDLITPYLQNNPSFLNSFQHTANWTSLDATIKSDSYLLNGFTFSSDSSNNYLNIFKNQEPQDITTTSILPRNTSYFIEFGFSDFKNYLKNYTAFLENSNRLFERNKQLKAINSKYDINLEEFFTDNVSKEMAVAIIEPEKQDYSANYVAVFKLINGEKTEKSIRELQNQILQIKHSADDTATTLYRKQKLGKINIPGILPMLFGENFVNINENYYAITDNYLVIANNTKVLRNVLSFKYNNKTLAKDSNYVAFSENISNESNIYIYSNIARSLEVYKKNVETNYKKDFDKKAELLRKFQAVTFQFSNQNELFYTNVYLKYKPIYKKETNSIWETPLDTTTSNTPKILADSKNETQYIFIQDDGMKIYLLNNKGELLWKKQLSEKIMGSASIVSGEENENSIIFSSAKAIYRYTISGEETNHFPIQLNATATIPVAVNDYSKKGDYRIFIACDDRKVYQFNSEGKSVKDWQCKKLDDIVTVPISLFTTGGRDFVLILDKAGNMKLLDKKGQWILRIKDKLPDYINNYYVLQKDRDIYQSSIFMFNSKGEKIRYYFRGKMEKETVAEQTNYNADIDPKNNVSGICAKNSFYTVNNKNEKSIPLVIEKAVVLIPQTFHLSNGKTIVAVRDKGKSELYLFDEKGTLLDDFPIVCNSGVDCISEKNAKNSYLLGVSEKRLFLYQIQD